MHFDLGLVRVNLESEHEWVRSTYASLLKGWNPQREGASRHEIGLSLQLSSELPPKPPQKAIYVQEPGAHPTGAGLLSVYPAASALTLRFNGCAQLTVAMTPASGDQAASIEGVVTPMAWARALFEDVLYAGLAPALRRLSIYLLHAFAVRRDDRTVLLVGASGSGKTTSGLILLEDGWGFLANDVVALTLTGEEVVALPTPDTISVTGETVGLLPWLADRVDGEPAGGKLRVSLEDFGGWSGPAPVASIYFPEVGSDQQTRVETLEKALGLALLAEGSLDKWDQASLPGHLDMLHGLSHQAQFRRLKLGRDAPYALPSLLDA